MECELREALREASLEIFKLKRQVSRIGIGQGEGPHKGVGDLAQCVERETQTAEPTEAGEFVSQQTLAKLATFKNLSRAFSLAQDKVNRFKRGAKKGFARTVVGRMEDSYERTARLVFSQLATQTHHIKPTVYMGFLLEAWRKVARQEAVGKAAKIREDAIVQAALVVEFRQRLCHTVLESTRAIFSVRGAAEWLQHRKQDDTQIWRVALFNHQKQRLLVGEMEGTDVELINLVPAPWYLAKYRVAALVQAVGQVQAGADLSLRFPTLTAAVPSFLLEVLGALREDEHNEELQKLLLDLLTFFFSALR